MAKRTTPKEREKLRQKKRLTKCYEYLQKQGKVETYNDLAEQMGVNPSTVRAAFSPSSPYFSANFLDKFLETYPDTFSRTWIVRGSGKMRPLLSEPTPVVLPQRWERIAYIIEKEELSIQEFAKEIGLSSPSTIYRIIASGARPHNSTLQKILDRFPLYGKEWLFEGTGEAYVPPEKEANREKQPAESSAEPYEVKEMMQFPVVPDAAAAGRLSGYGDPDPEGMEMMTIPVERRYRGNYYIFTVKGASMDDGSSDALVDGDKLLCREVDRLFWSHGLHRREWPYFVFATIEEGIIVKKVIAHDLQNDTITCGSLNPDYPDITLHLKDIIGIYNVVELISRSMKY